MKKNKDDLIHRLENAHLFLELLDSKEEHGFYLYYPHDSEEEGCPLKIIFTIEECVNQLESYEYIAVETTQRTYVNLAVFALIPDIVKEWEFLYITALENRNKSVMKRISEAKLENELSEDE